MAPVSFWGSKASRTSHQAALRALVNPYSRVMLVSLVLAAPTKAMGRSRTFFSSHNCFRRLVTPCPTPKVSIT
jgi:hypothetical protein